MFIVPETTHVTNDTLGPVPKEIFELYPAFTTNDTFTPNPVK
jgi:hypothetical protein